MFATKDAVPITLLKQYSAFLPFVQQNRGHTVINKDIRRKIYYHLIRVEQ